MLRSVSNFGSCLLGLVLVTQLASCLPVFDKYRTPKSEITSDGGTIPAASPSDKLSQQRRPPIYATNAGTFRLQISYERIWDGLLDVLLKNYNIQIADRANGLVTTDWDSYYLDGKIHRNKVSMRLKRLGPGLSELTIFNAVETLSQPDGRLTDIWLPSDRSKAEIGRIIQNVAIALGQPKPELPEEIAVQAQKGQEAGPKVKF